MARPAQMNNADNPFPRPARLDKAFGKFDVAVVDREYTRIEMVNMGKAHEYYSCYVTASHVYDASATVLKIMHVPSLPV